MRIHAWGPAPRPIPPLCRERLQREKVGMKSSLSLSAPWWLGQEPVGVLETKIPRKSLLILSETGNRELSYH